MSSISVVCVQSVNDAQHFTCVFNLISKRPDPVRCVIVSDCTDRDMFELQACSTNPRSAAAANSKSSGDSCLQKSANCICEVHQRAVLTLGWQVPLDFHSSECVCWVKESSCNIWPQSLSFQVACTHESSSIMVTQLARSLPCSSAVDKRHHEKHLHL